MEHSPAVFLVHGKSEFHYYLGDLQARGNSRFSYCSWRPLKFYPEQERVQQSILDSIFFDKKNYSSFSQAALKKYFSYRLNRKFKADGMKSSFLAGLGKEVKIVTHCGVNGAYFLNLPDEKAVRSRILTEYSIYKVLEAINGTTLKTRLLEVNYRDLSGKLILRHFAFIRESKKALAFRCSLTKKPIVNNGEDSENSRDYFYLLNRFASSFDANPEGGHNSLHLFDRKGQRHFIPYDYDLAWVSNPRYFKNPSTFLKDILKDHENYLFNLKGLQSVRAIAHGLYVHSRNKAMWKEINQIPFTNESRDFFSKWFLGQQEVLSNFLKEAQTNNPQEFEQVKFGLNQYLRAKKN